MSFETTRLDVAIAQKRAHWEQERQTILAQVLDWLDTVGHQHGIQQAYIFGSLSQAGRFTPTSDVDVAIVGLPPQSHFELMSHLQTLVGREVDMIELDRCHFQHRIRETGILWTPTA